eukprot:m51a1_g7331 hypothetical protein (294) ;mRNA; f:176518-177618
MASFNSRVGPPVGTPASEDLITYVKNRLLEITPEYSDSMLPELMPRAWSTLTLAELIAIDQEGRTRLVNTDSRAKPASRKKASYAMVRPQKVSSVDYQDALEMTAQRLTLPQKQDMPVFQRVFACSSSCRVLETLMNLAFSLLFEKRQARPPTDAGGQGESQSSVPLSLDRLARKLRDLSQLVANSKCHSLKQFYVPATAEAAVYAFRKSYTDDASGVLMSSGFRRLIHAISALSLSGSFDVAGSSRTLRTLFGVQDSLAALAAPNEDEVLSTLQSCVDENPALALLHKHFQH